MWERLCAADFSLPRKFFSWSLRAVTLTRKLCHWYTWYWDDNFCVFHPDLCNSWRFNTVWFLTISSDCQIFKILWFFLPTVNLNYFIYLQSAVVVNIRKPYDDKFPSHWVVKNRAKVLPSSNPYHPNSYADGFDVYFLDNKFLIFKNYNAFFFIFWLQFCSYKSCMLLWYQHMFVSLRGKRERLLFCNYWRLLLSW